MLIEKEGNLNSKAEFKSNKLTRLTVEATPWEEKKAAKEKLKAEKEEGSRISKLKSMVELQKLSGKGKGCTSKTGLNATTSCEKLNLGPKKPKVPKPLWILKTHV